jgi:hypothetical protein
MKGGLILAVIMGAIGACFAWIDPCAAQIITVPNPNPAPNQLLQNPQIGQVQPPLPTVGIPGTIVTPQTTAGLAGNPSISNPGPSFGSAGRGLPGMPGGPPINAPMGARDPTASYMRPPVVGPLLCDPAIDIEC